MQVTYLEGKLRTQQEKVEGLTAKRFTASKTFAVCVATTATALSFPWPGLAPASMVTTSLLLAVALATIMTAAFQGLFSSITDVSGAQALLALLERDLAEAKAALPDSDSA
jgi:hypothetical protein